MKQYISIIIIICQSIAVVMPFGKYFYSGHKTSQKLFSQPAIGPLDSLISDVSKKYTTPRTDSNITATKFANLVDTIIKVPGRMFPRNVGFVSYLMLFADADMAKSALDSPATIADTADIFCCLRQPACTNWKRYLFDNGGGLTVIHFPLTASSGEMLIDSSKIEGAFGLIQFDSSVHIENTHTPKVALDLERYYFRDSVTIFNSIHWDNGTYDTTFNNHSPNFLSCVFMKGISFNNFAEAPYDLDRLNIFGSQSVSSIFYKDFTFLYCVTFGTLNFSHCTFTKNCKFKYDRSFLPDTLDFTGATIEGQIDLTSAYPNYAGRRCELKLLNTDVNKINLQYTNFHLYLPSTILHDPNSRDVVSSFYEAFLNKFKKQGYTNSYIQLDEEYKEWQSIYNPFLRMSNLWWKFGYQKWRILFFTISFLLLFTLFNYSNYSRLQLVYPTTNLSLSETDSITRDGFTRVFLYTCAIFFTLALDFKNIIPGRNRWVAIIIIQYVVGLICSGFLVNWVLKG